MSRTRNSRVIDALYFERADIHKHYYSLVVLRDLSYIYTQSIKTHFRCDSLIAVQSSHQSLFLPIYTHAQLRKLKIKYHCR